MNKQGDSASCKELLDREFQPHTELYAAEWTQTDVAVFGEVKAEEIGAVALKVIFAAPFGSCYCL